MGTNSHGTILCKFLFSASWSDYQCQHNRRSRSRALDLYVCPSSKPSLVSKDWGSSCPCGLQSRYDKTPETMRSISGPRSVEVVAIMTGVVTTQLHCNDWDFGSPSNSRYTHVEEPHVQVACRVGQAQRAVQFQSLLVRCLRTYCRAQAQRFG